MSAQQITDTASFYWQKLQEVEAINRQLIAALKLMSKYSYADGSRCWCNEPPKISSATHSTRCEYVRTAFVKVEG